MGDIDGSVIGTLEGDIKPIRYAVTRERYLGLACTGQRIARIPVPTIRIILFKYGSNNSWGELFARPGISRDGYILFSLIVNEKYQRANRLCTSRNTAARRAALSAVRNGA